MEQAAVPAATTCASASDYSTGCRVLQRDSRGALRGSDEPARAARGSDIKLCCLEAPARHLHVWVRAYVCVCVCVSRVGVSARVR